MEKFFATTSIRAIATALPQEKLDLLSLSSIYGEEIVRKIIKNTGISEIRFCPPLPENNQKTSADYCMESAKRIFSEGKITPDDIDAIIFVTEFPDHIVPHTSAIIQAKLGLPNRVIAFDINYGCAGYVYGIFQASLLIESGYCENVLLCVGDTPTKAISPQDKSLRMVFGDAGSATILSRCENVRRTAFSFYTDGGRANNLMIPAGAFRMPHQEGVTDILTFDKNGNGRTLENIFMDGMQIMEFVLKHVKNVVHNTLEMLNLPIDAIDLFAFHQANILILNYLAQRLKIPHQKVPFGAAKTGNTTCASIPLMLSTLYPGINPLLEKVLICGFGTGLSCASGVIDLSRTEIFEPVQI